MCDAPDFKGAGGHFNPDGKQHGMDNPMGHHAGDMPQNLSVGEDQTGEITYKVDYLTLEPGAANSVLGHSIMVHEKADDMKTDPDRQRGQPHCVRSDSRGNVDGFRFAVCRVVACRSGWL